ncbi:MAG: hypothetical protein EOO90_17570 [Pedobacter sp.]|nr:MAG: hypothetical protein EOO90_17570 [Pedobacter sp.]
MRKFYQNAKLRLPLFVMVFAIVTGVMSCKKNDDGNYPEQPQLTLEGNKSILVKPNTPIVANLKFDAPGPDTKLLINKNNGPYRSIALDKNATSYTFNEDMVSTTAKEGDSVVYQFFLTNGANVKKSEGADLVVNVAIYNEITVGSTKVYNVTIPADGILSTGEITLAANRKYHISSSIQFSENTKFTVNRGAEVYMNAAATDKVNLTFDPGAEVSVNGTASAPVVMTSDKVLLGTTAASSDWGIFNIKGEGNGSNSGNVNYLRLEYAGNRAFRLQDVGKGTKIDYVQVYKSGEEGVMATNGDVNISHVITTECKGAGFRLGDAYSGKIQYAIALTKTQTGELDEISIRETATPIISNLTIIGPGETGSNTHGIRLRATSAAKIYNSIVAFYPRRGVRLNENVVTSGLNGPTVFAHSYVFKVSSDPYRDDRSGATNPFQGSFSDGVASNPFSNNVIYSATGARSFDEIAGIAVGVYVPTAVKTSTFNPRTLDPFFQDGAFVGAVESAAKDWTKAWTRNADGQIRN